MTRINCENRIIGVVEIITYHIKKKINSLVNTYDNGISIFFLLHLMIMTFELYDFFYTFLYDLIFSKKYLSFLYNDNVCVS